MAHNEYIGEISSDEPPLSLTNCKSDKDYKSLKITTYLMNYRPDNTK